MSKLRLQPGRVVLLWGGHAGAGGNRFDPRLFGTHHGGNPGTNLKSICHRCRPILVASVWEVT